MTKILVVDDEKIIRERLKDLLELDDYVVITAVDGQNGLEVFKQERPEIVVSDIKMPIMDGIELLKAIKEVSSETEVIMATGHGGVDTAIEAMKGGAFSYVQKPVEYDELEIEIKRAIEKQEMVKSLKASRVFNESIVTSIPSGLVVVDKDACIVSANPVFKNLFKDRELVGAPLFEFVPVEALKTAMEQVLVGGNAVHNIEMAVGFSAQQQSHFVVSAVRIQSAEDSGAKGSPTGVEKQQAQVLVVFEDITERKTMQARLLQSEKLSSLGLLSAGVAHELNSPLTGILNFVSVLKSRALKADPEGKDAKTFGFMETACEHMSKIITDLKDFSKASPSEVVVVDVNEVIESTLSFSGHHFKKKKIVIEKAYGEGLPKIKADKRQLQQVIINMITNARDVMDENGIFKIATRSVTDNGAGFVEMAFADNGCGMSQETASKIFDPFFTTKRTAGGTGLGLSIVHSIIETHKGSIVVKSEEGKGTTFLVRLPVGNEGTSA